jgi:glutamine synthetase
VANLPSQPSRDELRAFVKESNLQYATIGFVDYQGTVRGKYVARANLEWALDEISLPLTALAFDPTDAILFAPGIADIQSGLVTKRPSYCPRLPG